MRFVGITALPDKGVPYSRPHLYRLIKDGKFPRPVHLGPNRIAFVEEEIDAWLAARVAERDGRAA
jgi:prophage regulatory protein